MGLSELADGILDLLWQVEPAEVANEHEHCEKGKVLHLEEPDPQACAVNPRDWKHNAADDEQCP